MAIPLLLVHTEPLC